MLDITNMSCGYGAVLAVDDVTFQVPDGQMVALLGPNGAGKTSTVMAIAGHVEMFSGSITLGGKDLAGTGPAGRTRAGIGLVPEGRRIFGDLTVAENLLVGSYIRSRAEARDAEADALALFPRLRERYNQRAGSLSGGEQQMLAMARALVSRPSTLLVDELSLGLMPAVVHQCFETLAALKERGVSSLVVEQNTEVALRYADWVCVLAASKLIHSGPAADVRGDPGFVETLLGLSVDKAGA